MGVAEVIQQEIAERDHDRQQHGAVDRVAHRFGDSVQLDDVGMRAISASVAREFFAEQAAHKARQAEEQQRRTEEAARRETVLVGAPAQEGMTAAEAMRAADLSYKTPEEEFGGRERPNFIADMIDAGQRELAERQARAKARATEKMREDLQ